MDAVRFKKVSNSREASNTSNGRDASAAVTPAHAETPETRRKQATVGTPDTMRTIAAVHGKPATSGTPSTVGALAKK